jgi:polysaccharide chain length determinant protein (PEP-CTERM system associated)
MKEELQSLIEIAREMWRRRWLGVGIAWAVALLAGGALWVFKDRYETRARVYVDTETIIKPLLQGLTVQPDIDQMVAVLVRTLITRPNLERLVANAGLDRNAATSHAHERLVDALARQIKVMPAGGKNLFDIVYRDPDPERGQRVVEELVALFVSSGEGNNRRDTEQARKFIDEQIGIYEKKLAEAEERLKEFRLRNINITGGLGATAGQDYFARIASLQQDLASVRTDLSAAELSRDALQRQLNAERATQASSPETASAAVAELDVRLSTQRKQLDELRRGFTDEHPDVVAARRLIAQLEQERRQRIEYERQHPSGPGAAPKEDVALQQMKVKLAESEASAASLRGRASALAARLQELQSAASRVPQAEAELAQLNRDYDVIKRNYEQLVQRREAASISGHADEDGRLAEFRVIEPPRTGPRPVFPSRAMLVPLALLLSLGAGIATCYGLSQMMPTVHSGRALRALSQRPFLGTISTLPTPASLRSERRSNVLFGASVATLALLYGAWTLQIARGIFH